MSKSQPVQIRARINAPIDRVWSLITELDDYGSWSPFITQVESDGAPRVGDAIAFHVQFPNGHHTLARQQVEVVTAPTGGAAEFAYAYRGRLYPPHLVRARRSQALTAIDDDSCEYVTDETFWGLLSKSIPLGFVREGLQAHTTALKARAEGLTAPPVITHHALFALFRTPWVRQDLIHVSVRMRASASEIWARVKDLERYREFASGQLHARMVDGGPVRAGADLEQGLHALKGWRKGLLGRDLARTIEQVAVVDDERMALCWRADMPGGAGQSSRWQLVHQDGDEAVYETALHMPGRGGSLGVRLLGDAIRSAFTAAAMGIKAEVEAL